MIIGIMQPYFLPYIGYWQLMNAVDQYVIYDDVNYIKGGWINRNRILNHGMVQYINVYLKGASPNLLINQILVNHEAVLKNRTKRMIENCYSKAPFYQQGNELFGEILSCQEENLALFLMNSIRIICKYLEINTGLILSSELKKDNKLRGQEKVIEICRTLHADQYYNAIGGQQLYSFEEFAREGIDLHFFRTDQIIYQQFQEEFVPNLSILDMIMFNDKAKIKEYLSNYALVGKGEDR